MKIKNIRWGRFFGSLFLTVRVALGCLFIYSSLSKLRLPYDFLSNLYEYEMAGPKIGMLIAMTLPWMELLVGICLVGGIFIGGALLASALMGVVFTYAVGSAIYRGLDISCGCFGDGEGSIGYFTLIRAALIMIFSAAGFIFMTASESRLTTEYLENVTITKPIPA